MNLSVTHVLHAETHSVEPCALDDQLRAFWELEALGIQDEQKTMMISLELSYSRTGGTRSHYHGRSFMARCPTIIS